MAVFNIILLLLLAVDLCVFLKRNISDTLPLACLMIMVGMYLFSLANLLGAAIPGVAALVFAATALAGWKLACRQERINGILKEYVWTPALAVFALFAVLLFYLSRDVYVFQWDEYSHWATTVKDMYFTDRLSIYRASVTDFVSYPPMMALWQYFFVKLWGGWRDGAIIFAYNLYLLLMMLPIVGRLDWRRWPLIPVFFLILYYMPYWFYSPFEGSAWRCVYIDRALSFTFTYLMVSYFTTNKVEPLPLGLGMFVLPLLKSIGVAFSLFAAVAILADVALVNRRSRKKGLAILGGCVLVCGLAFYSWKARLWFAGTGGVWNTSRLTVKSVAKLILGREEEWKYHVTQAFWMYLCNNGLQHFHGLLVVTVAGFPALWAMVLLFAAFVSKKEKILKRNLVLMAILAVEFVIYEFSILLTQLYLLSQEEAAILSGLMRYSSNYALGVSCFLMIYVLGIVVDNLDAQELSLNVGIVCGLVLFTISTVPNSWVIADVFFHGKAVESGYVLTGFTPYKGLEERLSHVLTKEDNVYLVAEDFGYHVLRKMMIPASTGPFWVDLITQEDTVATWQEKIADGGYNYVYVDEVSDGFKDTFQSCFENGVIESQSLYKVAGQEELYLVKVFGQ